MAGHILTAEVHRPAARLAESCQRLDQFLLTVAGNAGDAEDLPAADVDD